MNSEMGGFGFDRIDSSLEGLRNQLEKFLRENPTDPKNHGLYFFNGISEFEEDMQFLKMLWESIHKWSDADKMFVKSSGRQRGGGGGESQSLALRIEAAAQEIAEDLTVELYSLPELNRLIMNCHRKCKHFMAGIREAVEHLSDGSCSYSFQVHSPPTDHSFWTSFVDSIKRILFSIDYFTHELSAFYYEVSLLQNFITDVLKGFKSIFPAAAADDGADDGQVIIDAFLNNVASLLVRIAIQSCSFWLAINYRVRWVNKVDPDPDPNIKIIELMNLKHEIDGRNPKFLEFLLKFLKALNKNKEIDSSKYLVHHFCTYFLRGRSDAKIEKELESLVILLINNRKLEDSREDDVQSVFAETSAVLVQVAFDLNPNSELLTKISLLKAEIFLKEQLNGRTFSILCYEPHIGELKNSLRNLRRYFEDVSQEKIEYGTQILALIEEVAMEVAYVVDLRTAKKIIKSTVKNSLVQLLSKMVMFRAELSLMKLLKSNATFMDYEKEQIHFLLKQLKFFTLFLTNELMKEKENADIIFAQIETFARWVTCFSYSFMIKKTILSFSELLDKVKPIEAKLKENSPKIPLSNFPKTYKLGFIDFLIRNLRELLKYDPESIAPVKHYIEEIQLCLSSFLMKVSELDIEQPELKDLGDHVMDVAYKVEYVVDLIVIDAQWQHFCWFYAILDELRLVTKQEASQIHETICDGKVQNETQVSCDMISRCRTPATDEMVVDLSDEVEVILDELTRGSLQRDTVSIVGMAGIGKTTLARKVYNNQKVIYHFHRRAWCTVSQLYEKRELLIEILSDIHGLTEEINQMNTEDLELKLRQCLLGNKYLIVMDDMWDVGAWSDLQNSFPDNLNGSRILITSRLRGVALRIKPNGDPHSLRPFSDDESWKLLEKKIFQGEGCPEELLLVGKKIAQQCKGLPLAVIAISGLLHKTEKRKGWWIKIGESLSSEIIKDPEAQCMEILELSYKHLPGYLKVCFLYLGVFLEDKDIPVTKLIRFWLAEGFIQNTKSKSLEEVAEDYLMNLINRSLVIISKRRSNGKVKACRLHDLIRDFCQLKATEENFLQLLTRRDKPYDSFPSSDYGFDLYFDHPLDPLTHMAYRLSIFLKRNHFVESKPSGLGTRSLIFFAFADSEPRCPYDISFICHNFKLLRMLDIECINMGISFPVEIGLLVRLRYLAVCGYVRSIPQSIADLHNLETFVVKGLRGKVVLPSSIWRMKKLRHLHVNYHVAFHWGAEELGGCFQLENLVSFSCPSLSCGEDTERIIKRLPNLCKLRCIFFESRDSSRNFKRFPRLNFLAHLESLNIFYYGNALTTSEFVLPLNLKKLTLSNFCLPWDHISAIGRLPNLQVLKLVSGAFEGRIWDMREKEFLELIFLKLDTLNIAQWNASCVHLPKLQRLVLRNCKDLKEVPEDFADITSLKMIEVQWCGQSVEESAKQIGETTGEIKVLVNRT